MQGKGNIMPYLKEDRPKYYPFVISFTTEKEMENFKNYAHSAKTATGKAIGRLATEMMELHRLKSNEKKR